MSRGQGWFPYAGQPGNSNPALAPWLQWMIRYMQPGVFAVGLSCRNR